MGTQIKHLNKLLMTFLDGKGVCLILIGKKIESHYFLWNLQIFLYQGLAGLQTQHRMEHSLTLLLEIVHYRHNLQSSHLI